MPWTRIGFAEFWPVYLRAHSRPRTRMAHYVATVFGLGAGVTGLVLALPWLIVLAVIGGYTIAIGSHYVFEKNAPVVSSDALMAICCDLWMFVLFVRGRLHLELSRHGISH